VLDGTMKVNHHLLAVMFFPGVVRSSNCNSKVARRIKPLAARNPIVTPARPNNAMKRPFVIPCMSLASDTRNECCRAGLLDTLITFQHF
jgi:hypothetical protein